MGDPALTTEDRYKGIEVVPTSMPDEEVVRRPPRLERSRGSEKGPSVCVSAGALGSGLLDPPNGRRRGELHARGRSVRSEICWRLEARSSKDRGVLPEGFFNA